MRCPICKKTIPANTVKCPYCKTRTGLICKDCGSVNSLFETKCKSCGKEILKQCPNCNGINFPNAQKCRKCGYVFETQQENTEIRLEYPANLISQKKAKNILVRGISSNDKKIFSLSGEKGCGKSLVLKAVKQELKDFFWISGKCTPITQLTPAGLIQDILLNIFNLPNFCINNPQFMKDASVYFKNEFPELQNNEISDLINFLYPSQEGDFENIVSQKHKTFDMLNKIFDKIIKNKKFIIVIDNFEFIDGFSYEFINHYIKKDNVWKTLKFLLIYNESKPAKGYFYFPEDERIYLDVGIAPIDFQQMHTIVGNKIKKIEGFPEFSTSELRQIYTISNGNPSYINHALNLCFDCQLAGKPFELSNSFKGLLELRLALLSDLNPVAYDILLGSAIIGEKINVNLMKEIFEVDDKSFHEIMIYLKKMGYINPLNDIFCEFSSRLLWETILKNAKNDINYEAINKKILKHLSSFTLNSNSIFAVIAQYLKQPKLALDIWTQTTRLAAYIGDLNLYAIAQKQSLAMINEFDEKDTLKIRYNISERLGKLLANSNPNDAIEYLPDAISNAQAIGNGPKEVELLAYLASCCRKTGRYFGEVECVDKVLEKVNPENKLQKALLKTTKLKALLNIGNCGQIVNMIDNEIMPELDEFFKKHTNPKDPEVSKMFEVWLKTYLTLANALVMQGNDRSFEILNTLSDIIKTNQIQDELFICKCQLTLAFANTMKGNFRDSERLLKETLNSYRENVMNNETIIRWNFINIVNNFLLKQYNGMQEELFQIVTFANNNGDNFTKNILKTLLGKVFKDSENSKQASEIYNDQIAYFAKEKMVFGALLTWLLIADVTIVTEGPKNALEIAQQALEVSQNPHIENYFFDVLLRMVIAKCCIILSDFDTAKIHIETGIKIAKKYNMNDLLSRLYILYGKYLQEIGLVKSPEQKDYLKNARKMYEKATKIIRFTKNTSVLADLRKAEKSLDIFCKVNYLTI